MNHAPRALFTLATLSAAVGQLCCGPDFSQAAIDRADVGARLPASFMLGVGTSAYQIEGNSDNDWVDWEQGFFADGSPHVANGTPSGRADDSWHLWADDLRALDYLGANAYRLGIEWSRLEPAEGQWDDAAVAHYRDELGALRAHGIEPFVTVQHITLPRWVAAHGGWEWEGIVDALVELGEHLGLAFGDLVDNWVTINEPNAIFSAAYVVGRWAPGVADTSRAVRVYARTLDAHAAIAQALRRSDVVAARGPGYAATFIGLAHNMAVFQAATSSPLDAVISGYGDEVLNEVVPKAVLSGIIDINVPGAPPIVRSNPALIGSFDYLGLNYYRRTDVRIDTVPTPEIRSFTPAFAPQSDLGWEVDARGLYVILKRCASYGWPVVITENGVADPTDALRQQYLRAHVFAMEQAMAEGVDVRGYFHWTLADNFELNAGFTQKLGLFSVDPLDPALKRVPKPSTEVFRAIARRMGRTPAAQLP
jgi:beta-glucosidase